MTRLVGLLRIPLQLLAHGVFVLASAMVILLLAIPVAMAGAGALGSGGGSMGTWLLIAFCLGGAIWLGTAIALAARRGRDDRPLWLRLLYQLGGPAREFFRFTNSVFFRVDRWFAKPLVWAFQRPVRAVIVGVVLLVIAVMAVLAILFPGRLIAWGNQYASGTRLVGGFSGVWILFVVLIGLLVAALIWFGLWAFWVRSIFLALPLAAFNLLCMRGGLPGDAADAFRPLAPFWEPMRLLLAYRPMDIRSAHVDDSIAWLWQLLDVIFTGPWAIAGLGTSTQEFDFTALGMFLAGMLVFGVARIIERAGGRRRDDLIPQGGKSLAWGSVVLLFVVTVPIAGAGGVVGGWVVLALAIAAIVSFGLFLSWAVRTRPRY